MTMHEVRDLIQLGIQSYGFVPIYRHAYSDTWRNLWTAVADEKTILLPVGASVSRVVSEAIKGEIHENA